MNCVVTFCAFELPAWTAGCKVFTLPPSISGAPVSSETSLNTVDYTLYLNKFQGW